MSSSDAAAPDLDEECANKFDNSHFKYVFRVALLKKCQYCRLDGVYHSLPYVILLCIVPPSFEEDESWCNNSEQDDGVRSMPHTHVGRVRVLISTISHERHGHAATALVPLRHL